MVSLCNMQITVKMKCRAEEYKREKLYNQVQRPRLCPNCKRCKRLEAHGYYERGITDNGGQIIVISVRRFKCRNCDITISCLPSFALPYRLINCETTEQYFNGRTGSASIDRNKDLLRRYWLRFEHWSRNLRSIIGSGLGRSPPFEKAKSLWLRLMAACITLSDCTCRLIQDFRTTCFGSYRCHQPLPAR